MLCCLENITKIRQNVSHFVEDGQLATHAKSINSIKTLRVDLSEQHFRILFICVSQISVTNKHRFFQDLVTFKTGYVDYEMMLIVNFSGQL